MQILFLSSVHGVPTAGPTGLNRTGKAFADQILLGQSVAARARAAGGMNRLLSATGVRGLVPPPWNGVSYSYQRLRTSGATFRSMFADANASQMNVGAEMQMEFGRFPRCCGLH